MLTETESVVGMFSSINVDLDHPFICNFSLMFQKFLFYVLKSSDFSLIFQKFLFYVLKSSDFSLIFQKLLFYVLKSSDFSLIFQKFLFYVLKSSDVLNVLVPILYHLNDSRGDPCKYLMNRFDRILCVFNIFVWLPNLNLYPFHLCGGANQYPFFCCLS